MKNATVILIALFVLSASLRNGVVYLSFKINQGEIVSLFCVNKERPAMHCDGKCYLNERLAKTNDRENKSAPFTQFDESLRINFYCHTQEALPAPDLCAGSRPGFHYEGLISLPGPAPFLPPPRNCARPFSFS